MLKLKIFLRLFAFSMLLIHSFQHANAAQLPRFLGAEKKFRSYVYNPNDVYRYIGHYNYQGFIEFDAGESIATISMGDPSLWLFEHLGNRLFLKPVGEYDSQTNMTVITNNKVYHFELMAREADNINDKNLIFVVKFIYPDEEDKNIVQFPKKTPSDEPDLRNLSQYNFSYEYTGDPTIAPLKVFDNGEFTYFQFAEKSAEIPAIFNVDSNGFESLVNFRAAGSYIIVERVGSQFTLRNGNEIVCVYNMDRYSSGRLRGGSAPASFSGTGSIPRGIPSSNNGGIVDPISMGRQMGGLQNMQPQPQNPAIISRPSTPAQSPTIGRAPFGY